MVAPVGCGGLLPVEERAASEAVGRCFFHTYPWINGRKPVFQRFLELPVDTGELYLVAIAGQQFYA
jgi:hypothetical protein